MHAFALKQKPDQETKSANFAGFAPKFPASIPETSHLQRTCACGGGCPTCVNKHDAGDQPFTIQKKSLEISNPADAAEIEADEIARKVVDGQSGEIRESSAAVNRSGENSAEISAEFRSKLESSKSGGQSLDDSTRTEMESKMGADFSSVKIHTGGEAHKMSEDISAKAFTHGQDIFFTRGQFNTSSKQGKELLAHELAHTVQQSRGNFIVQRFVSCVNTGMSLETCPKRETGEESRSLTEPMIIEYITSPEIGYLIGNFGVGKSVLKTSAKTHPHWAKLLKTITAPGSVWEVVGLSDCHGDEKKNSPIRQQRADAVRAALPLSAVAHISGTSGAAFGDCLTDNGNEIDRALNRAVLITPELRVLDITSTEDESIKGERRVPKPVEQSTDDCSDSQEKEIAQAQSIAVAMVDKTLVYLHDMNNDNVKQLLRKYFSDDSEKTYERVREGLISIRKGMRGGIGFECEENCSDVAYVYKRFGTKVHLCPSAFGDSDLELASTIIHEFSHLFDLTDDNAENPHNEADNYAEFAERVYQL